MMKANGHEYAEDTDEKEKAPVSDRENGSLSNTTNTNAGTGTGAEASISVSDSEGAESEGMRGIKMAELNQGEKSTSEREQEGDSSDLGSQCKYSKKADLCYVVGWSPSLRGVGVVFGDGSFGMLHPDRLENEHAERSEKAGGGQEEGKGKGGHRESLACLCSPRVHTVQLLPYAHQSRGQRIGGEIELREMISAGE